MKLSIGTRVLGGAVVALGLVNTALLLRPGTLGSQSQTDVHAYPPGYPPVTSRYDLVEEDVITFSMRQPFYTPAKIDSLRQGDILYITVSGQGIWRQVPDPKATAVHQTFRLCPNGPEAVVKPDGQETSIPHGLVNRPKDLSAGYRSKEFPHQDAPMAALVGAVGVLVYDRDGMAGRLDEHFYVGTKRWLRIDGRPSKDAQLLFTLNLRWRETAWLHNEGIYSIITRVFRPRVTGTS